MTDVLTVGALGSMLLTRWKLIVAFVVLGVGAGVAYGMLAPATYTVQGRAVRHRDAGRQGRLLPGGPVRREAGRHLPRAAQRAGGARPHPHRARPRPAGIRPHPDADGDQPHRLLAGRGVGDGRHARARPAAGRHRGPVPRRLRRRPRGQRHQGRGRDDQDGRPRARAAVPVLPVADGARSPRRVGRRCPRGRRRPDRQRLEASPARWRQAARRRPSPPRPSPPGRRTPAPSGPVGHAPASGGAARGRAPGADSCCGPDRGRRRHGPGRTGAPPTASPGLPSPPRSTRNGPPSPAPPR